MNLENAIDLCGYLGRDYSEDFFRLLVNYHDISATEAASWLGIQASAAGEFLDGLTRQGVVEKSTHAQGKADHSRYRLLQREIQLSIDLSSKYLCDLAIGVDRSVRRRDSASSEFVLAKSGDRYLSVTIWKGMGRGRVKREIWLTPAQGNFLFYLPISQSDPVTIEEVMQRAEVGGEHETEILLIVDELAQMRVIEVD